MKSFNIFVIVFLIVLVSGGAYLYFFHEKKIDNTSFNFTKITIGAKDVNNKFVKTGYQIYLDGNLFKNGTTELNHFVIFDIPINKSLEIYNSNLENQTYYLTENSFSTYNLTKRDTTRCILKLKNYGFFNITNYSFDISNNKINTTLKFLDDFQDGILCIDWSNKFVTVDLKNYTKIENINNSKRCYKFPKLINKSEEVNLHFNYFNFGYLDDSDFVSLTTYYAEKQKRNPIKYNFIQREDLVFKQ